MGCPPGSCPGRAVLPRCAGPWAAERVAEEAEVVPPALVLLVLPVPVLTGRERAGSERWASVVPLERSARSAPVASAQGWGPSSRAPMVLPTRPGVPRLGVVETRGASPPASLLWSQLTTHPIPQLATSEDRYPSALRPAASDQHRRSTSSALGRLRQPRPRKECRCCAS